MKDNWSLVTSLEGLVKDKGIFFFTGLAGGWVGGRLVKDNVSAAER